MNVKTQTTTTEDYPEAGPFETKSEAMRAFVPPLGQTVLSVERRDDGWYRTYMVSSTTSLYFGYQMKQAPDWIKKLKDLIKRRRGKNA